MGSDAYHLAVRRRQPAEIGFCMNVSTMGARRSECRFRSRSRGFSAGLLLCMAALTACQSAPAGPAAVASSSKSAALRTMEQVAITAHKCWFASNDAAFRSYSFANELNSFSGRPRFLLVPKSNSGGGRSGQGGRVRTAPGPARGTPHFRRSQAVDRRLGFLLADGVNGVASVWAAGRRAISRRVSTLPCAPSSGRCQCPSIGRR